MERHEHSGAIMQFAQTITNLTELRAVYGQPMPLAAAAKADRLDNLCRRFIALSPLVVFSSADGEGRQDCSPRGDAPGFVTVLDDRTIAIPDRPGNNKIETLSNLLERPNIGLLFVIPGHEETLRLNGTARIVCDAALLARAAVNGKVPKGLIVVDIAEVYPHCGKAFRRAGLWDVSTHAAKGTVPSLASIALKMAGRHDEDLATVEARTTRSYNTDLY